MNQKFHNKQWQQETSLLSYDYIRGLIEGEGCFTFCQGYRKPNGSKYKIPTFCIGLHERDFELLKLMKDRLNLKSSIYIQSPYNKDGYNRGKRACLMVRDFHELKDIIIPLFYRKLKGNKGKQFTAWLEKIGQDQDVSNRYKALYRIYKFGIYDQPKFLDKYKN